MQATTSCVSGYAIHKKALLKYNLHIVKFTYYQFNEFL